MTSSYFFPLMDVVLARPNISRCNKFRCVEVEIMFLLEKEFLICFPFGHATQSKSSLYGILGNSLTWLCFYSFEINLKLA